MVAAALAYGLPVALVAVCSTMWPLKHAIALVTSTSPRANSQRPVPVSEGG